jgi:hypothetical protein
VATRPYVARSGTNVFMRRLYSPGLRQTIELLVMHDIKLD